MWIFDDREGMTRTDTMLEVDLSCQVIPLLQGNPESCDLLRLKGRVGWEG